MIIFSEQLAYGFKSEVSLFPICLNSEGTTRLIAQALGEIMDLNYQATTTTRITFIRVFFIYINCKSSRVSLVYEPAIVNTTFKA